MIDNIQLSNIINEAILDKLTRIGFNIHTERETTVGEMKELKFYPNYLNGTHYTMVFFKFKAGGSGRADFRLYEHRNEDGAFVDSLFQLNSSHEDTIHNKLEDIFKSEIRNNTISKILIDE